MRFLCVIFALSALVSCEKPPEPAPSGPTPVLLPENYRWLKPAAANDLFKTKPNLGVLDARNDEERLAGNGWLHDSKPCPWLGDHDSVLQSLDRGKPWLVYCTIGGRSELLAKQMAAMNFKEVYLLQGGFAAWNAAGLPVDR